MREIDLSHFSLFSHPFRMRSYIESVSRGYASLQPLATLSNPSGVGFLTQCCIRQGQRI
jgi:hypothetical protein